MSSTRPRPPGGQRPARALSGHPGQPCAPGTGAW